MNDKLIKIGDKTYKEAKTIMLPARDEKKLFKGQLWTHNNGGITKLHLWTSETTDVSTHELLGYCIPQHLYIITSEEIKKGDWYYNERLNEVFQALGYVKYNTVDKEYKIIASTDPSLITKEYDGLDEKGQKQYCNKYLPRPSDDFIKKFVELNAEIKDVLVELLSDTKSRIRGTVHYGQPVNSIKIAPDNTISIIKKQNNFKELYMKALKKLDTLSDEQLEYFVNFQNKEEEKFYSKNQILEKVNQWFREEASVNGLDAEPIDKWLTKNL